VFIKSSATYIVPTCCQYNQDICTDTISGDEDALVMATYRQIQFHYYNNPPKKANLHNLVNCWSCSQAFQY